jgi:hypothetical protein
VTAPVPWTERGRDLGATLDHCFAIVVVGSDPVITADAAIGIARAQAERRHVAICDLIGEAPPLEALAPGDDPHGIVDSFTFGVSLNRIARPVPNGGSLFVIPSGSTPIDHEELLSNPRWRRLTSGFREVGALLVLVAPAAAAHLLDLVEVTDGVVIVGDTVPGDIPVAQTLAWLRPKRSGLTSVAGAPLAVVEAAKTGKPPAERSLRWLAGAAGVLLTIGAILGGIWFARRPFDKGHAPPHVGGSAAAAQKATAGALVTDSNALSLADSLKRDSLRAAMSAPPAAATSADSFPLLVPANGADSARAAAWAVRLEQTNTKSGAILDLRGKFETVPAGTYGFDLRTRFFLLVAGAYPTRAGAESLLVRLRSQKILAPGIGNVVALPFAFMVQSDVPAADVPARLARYAARGHPVYALRQTNGAAHLYFGAYESAQHAALDVPTVREAGLTPTLVYRIGRVF